MGILLSNNKKMILLILGGIGLYLALTLPFLQKMPVTTDEVQFAEPAYNFITYGHFGTTSLSGLFDFHQKTYWQHPLYLALMYFPIKIFGYNFWSIKILSVVTGLIALIFAYRIGRELGVPHLFPAMLTLNALFIFLAKIGRMEALTMCLALAAFYYAVKQKYLLAGLVSSLALLTHPIGAFTVLNALTVFIYHRKFDARYFLGLALPFIVVFSFVLDDFREFKRQYLMVQNYLYDARGLLGGPGTHLENFLALVDRSGAWLKLQLPIFVLFIWGIFQKKDGLQKTVAVIALVNFLGLALLVPNKYVNYYSALVLPFTILFVAMAVASNRRIPVILVLVITLAANGLMAAKVNSSFIDNDNNILALEMLIKPGATILGPPALGVPLKDRRVVGFHAVKMIMDLEEKTAEEALAELKPDYIVVDSSVTGEQTWRLFTESEDKFIAFLKENTVFRGKTGFNGDDVYIFEMLHN
ncbi:MAG: hypothetical protein ACOY4Q_09610 [Bacillota bacterium]